MALTHEKLAQIDVEIGDAGSALDHYRQADMRFKDLAQADPTNAKARTDLELNDSYFADALKDAGDLREALETSNEALRIAEDLRNADPKNAQMLGHVALARWTTAAILARMGDATGAVQNYQAGLSMIEPLLAADSSNILTRAAIAQGLTAPAGPLMKVGQVNHARLLTTRALVMQRELAERSEVTAWELQRYASTLLTCEPRALRDPLRAKLYAERAAQLTNAENPHALDTLALAYFETGDPARAVETEKKALALVRAESPTPHAALRVQMQSNLARFQLALARRSPKPAE